MEVGPGPWDLGGGPPVRMPREPRILPPAPFSVSQAPTRQ